ncbi:hypothetical protein HDU76_000384 [Blyttiomyces sp. JEL0837]|nr:hypothetical protein HDU76_000384 [Blyttiomyces sp. JEL0837]
MAPLPQDFVPSTSSTSTHPKSSTMSTTKSKSTSSQQGQQQQSKSTTTSSRKSTRSTTPTSTDLNESSTTTNQVHMHVQMSPMGGDNMNSINTADVNAGGAAGGSIPILPTPNTSGSNLGLTTITSGGATDPGAATMALNLGLGVGFTVVLVVGIAAFALFKRKRSLTKLNSDDAASAMRRVDHTLTRGGGRRPSAFSTTTTETATGTGGMAQYSRAASVVSLDWSVAGESMYSSGVPGPVLYPHGGDMGPGAFRDARVSRFDVNV